MELTHQPTLAGVHHLDVSQVLQSWLIMLLIRITSSLHHTASLPTLIQSEKMSVFFIAVSQNSGIPVAGDDEAPSPSSSAVSKFNLCSPRNLTDLCPQPRPSTGTPRLLAHVLPSQSSSSGERGERGEGDQKVRGQLYTWSRIGWYCFMYFTSSN